MFNFTSRIAKLDAVSLDKEFLIFLKREVGSLLSILTTEEYLQKLTPEITLIIKFVIWKFSTASTGSTIGQKLLGIKYAHSSFPGKLKLLFVLEGVIPYLIERLRSIRDTPIIEYIREPLRQAERLYKILHVLNFCTYLFQNRYPTLSTRFVGLQMIPVDYRFGPTSGFTYQIRELLWHQFADFLIMVLPLINFRKIKRTFLHFLNGNANTQSLTDISSGSDNRFVNDDSAQDKDVLQCTVCNEDAVIPQTVGKEHYCYFCYHSVFNDKL